MADTLVGFVAGTVSLADLVENYPPDPKRADWSWADEEEDILARLCLCCGRPGHYQSQLEAHVAEYGLTEGIYVADDGKIDGHHRVVAAIRLGIDTLPLESRDDSGKRYLRDHGPIAWEHRIKGDVAPDHASPLHKRLWAAQDALALAEVGQPDWAAGDGS